MSPRPPATTPRSRTPMLIGVVVAVVAAFAIAAVAVTGSGDDDGVARDTDSRVTVSRNTVADASTTNDVGRAAGAAAPIDPLGAVVAVEGEPLPLRPRDGSDTAVGQMAPALRGTDYDGQPMTIEPGTSGRATLVVFLAHWCPHCNDEIPRLLEWRDAGGVPDDLDVIGVSTAISADRPNFPPGEWLQEKGWEWPVLADDIPTEEDMAPTAATAYGVDGFPYFALLDAEGRVVVRDSGELSVEQLAEIAELVTVA